MNTHALRTLIVDDSMVFRTFLRRCLSEIDGVEVVGAAADGKAALRRIEELKPDLVTLDIEMPHLDGIDVLNALHDQSPDTRVVIVTSETVSNAGRAVEALEAGAFEIILKPRAASSEDRQELVDQLRACLQAARSISVVTKGKSGKLRSRASPPASVDRPRQADVVAISSPPPLSFRPDVIAIGTSTGGPQALSAVLTPLPASMRTPIVITQHMPGLFIRSLAERLDRETQLTCHVAEEGMPLLAGHVYLAPGNVHLEVNRVGGIFKASLVDGPKVHHCKPAVDPMFFSLRRLAPTVRTLAVVLTGMGSDGAAGAAALASAGGFVIVQDEASSTVWGMPGATVKAGAAHQVLPLSEVAPLLNQYGAQISTERGAR
ncbi:chemotaxis-specific protein-glutamate methyltransferase CheB [Mariprofundus erugo]|nr:chemotaxis-specific protein-glutamate methyltransferase CheB [Mariprofundus erugo]